MIRRRRQVGRGIAAGPANNLVRPSQFHAGLLHDGNGGALVAFNDTNGSTYFQAFATRITKDAAVAWGNPGEPIQRVAGDNIVLCEALRAD